MKLMNKSLMILLLSTNLIANNAFATDQCKDVEDAATTAVSAANKVIDLRVKEIKAQDDLITFQSKQIVDLQNQNDSWTKSPWLFFALGIVVTTASAYSLSKVTK
jgi:hypothetical protein